MRNLVLHGLYKVRNNYFQEFQNPYWIDNKNENRPYYYLLRDSDGIDWLIPLSSQVENYRRKLQRVEEKRGEGNCVYYHIGLVAGTERVFLIGDMFPVNESYIKAPFYIGKNHYISRDKKLNDALYSKTMRFLKLIESGAMKSRNDILGIKRVLLNRKGNAAYMI